MQELGLKPSNISTSTKEAGGAIAFKKEGNITYAIKEGVIVGTNDYLTSGFLVSNELYNSDIELLKSMWGNVLCRVPYNYRPMINSLKRDQ